MTHQRAERLSAALHASLADPAAERSVGRWLVQNSAEQLPLQVGLYLLARTGTAYDLPMIRKAGLDPAHTAPAAAALAAIGGTTADLDWLAERCTRHQRIAMLRALCERPSPAARRWLLRNATRFDRVPNPTIRQIAEAVDLLGLLGDVDTAESTRVDAGRALLAMSRWSAFPPEIGRYADAVPAYRALLRRAERWSASLDRAALLIEVAQELTTGHSWQLGWQAGETGRLVDGVLARLVSPTWTRCLDAALAAPLPLARHRAAWARWALADLTDHHPAGGRNAHLALRVLRGDPAWSELLEARVLVDGVPLLRPDHDDRAAGLLIASGPGPLVWRHHGDPGTVLTRAGNTVSWQSPAPGRTVVFGAAQYDAEVARAEADHSWDLPADDPVRSAVPWTG